ncbi:unnamed protein product, partial [Adineta steineri]
TTTNQPNLCSSATWYTNATTFANSSTIGINSTGVFVSVNNTLYVVNQQTNKVIVWYNGSINPDQIISGNLSRPFDLFTTPIGDIYVDNGLSYSRVDKFSFNSSINTSVMSVPNQCNGIFVDISNTLYCSASNSHQVVKKWLNDNVLTSTMVAGTGTAGSTATTLNKPIGIFVDAQVNLYVADSLNNRVQMFAVGQSTGITVAGASASGTITLNNPYGITLDGNGYLFIADCYNHRIVGSGPNGFRCLFGCTTIAGSSSSQLNYPTSLSFDSYGNLYVADRSNNRQYRPPPALLLPQAAAPQVVVLLLPQAAALQVALPLLLPQVAAAAPQVALLPPPPPPLVRLLLPRAAAAALQVALLPLPLLPLPPPATALLVALLLPLLLAVLLPPVKVPQAALLLQLPPVVLLALVKVPQAAVRRVVAVLQVVLLQVALLLLPLPPPLVEPLQAAAVPQVALLLPVILQQVGLLHVNLNQPSFCPSITWYTDAITFANSSTVGTYVYGVFVSTNNTIYVANQQTNQVIVWYDGSINPDKILSGSLSSPFDLFVTPVGDIYVDNGLTNRRVDKFSFNSSISTSVMSVPYTCVGIFVDISNTLYCSTFTAHQVVKKWLNSSVLTSTIVAGNGTAGSTAATLNTPIGIFVDVKINLYVADSANNRIQMFPVGQLTGITLAGASVPGTITLNQPNGITLDGNGYLFIVDCYNNRIVGSGPYGFRCLFGCTTIYGSAPSQLYLPGTLSFDSYGNLFVADRFNYRVQKFILASNSCSLSYNQPTFCSNASWSVNAVTFPSSTTIGSLPYGIFVDGINTVYVPNRATSAILSWPQGSNTSTSNSYSNLSNPYSLFMSITGDIYIDNGYLYGRVDKYTFNTSNRVTVMNVNGSCFGLFIDINNNLYCSLKNLHQVVKVLLNNGTTIPTIAAGNG